jgi:hypothetical protein
LELLTILYAMLAALTGFSVGEVAPARQAVVASVQVERTEIAVNTIRKLPPAITEFGRRVGRALRPQRTSTDDAVQTLPSVQQVAYLDLGRRHL